VLVGALAWLDAGGGLARSADGAVLAHAVKRMPIRATPSLAFTAITSPSAQSTASRWRAVAAGRLTAHLPALSTSLPALSTSAPAAALAGA